MRPCKLSAIKTLIAALSLGMLTAASCEHDREFTCKHVEGVGWHKVTMIKCTNAKVRVLDGKLYLDEKGTCEEKVVEYLGPYSYSEYTGKSGYKFSVDVKDIVGLAAAAG